MIKRVFTAINILIVTGIVYFFITAFYQKVEARLDYAGVSVPRGEMTATVTKEVRHPLSYYSPITKRNLFKTVTDEEKKAAEKVVEKIDPNVKPTELKLKLWGTVSGDRKYAYAVIQDQKTRKQNLYREGETVQNALIKRIEKTRVILSVNGKDESLNLEDGTSKSDRGGRPGVPSTPMHKASAGPTRDYSLKRDEIDSAMNDVNTLMKQAKIRPHFKNGKPDGLTITRIKRGSIFSKLGLKNGDIISGVDGNTIETVDDALEFYNSLKESSNVNLQIRRRGKERNLKYSIE